MIGKFTTMVLTNLIVVVDNLGVVLVHLVLVVVNSGIVIGNFTTNSAQLHNHGASQFSINGTQFRCGDR
jgi:hypothetical protein